MRAHLELFTALLVDVRAAKDGVTLDAGGHWNWAADASVGTLGVVHDFLGRRIEGTVIVGFHPNPNSRLITSHSVFRLFAFQRGPTKSSGTSTTGLSPAKASGKD